jgi:hypothetical protein
LAGIYEILHGTSYVNTYGALVLYVGVDVAGGTPVHPWSASVPTNGHVTGAQTKQLTLATAGLTVQQLIQVNITGTINNTYSRNMTMRPVRVG